MKIDCSEKLLNTQLYETFVMFVGKNIENIAFGIHS